MFEALFASFPYGSVLLKFTRGDRLPRRRRAAIVGSGNIGTDLLDKLLRSDCRAALDGRHRPGPEGLRLAADARPRGVARGRRLAAQAGRAAGPRLRGDVGLRAPRVRAALRGGRHPRRRPDARHGRPGGDPAGQPRGAPRRAERQHDHLRRPGHDPDGRRGLAGRPVSYAEIVATVASVSAGPGTRANIDEFTRTTAAGSSSAARSAARRSSSSTRPTRR